MDTRVGSTAADLARPASRSAARAFDRFLLSLLARALGQIPIEFVLWDGTTRALSLGPSVARVRIRDRATLLGLVRAPELTFGEAYTDGRLVVEGSLLALLESVIRSRLGKRMGSRSRRPARHGLTTSRKNARRHYDLGNDFYELWLDPELVYTCAYYAEPDLSLAEAQRAKMDYVCRKLRLAPGERVAEAGCGWGALALFMARNYGVTVDAYNVSKEQVRHARERARKEGLADRVTFHEDDYRAIEGRYDVFVSVGMVEHVGPENYRVLGSVVDRVLPEDRGRGLLHFIGRDRPWPLDPWIEKHIFPGAYPPTIAEVATSGLEPFGLSILDVENLRLHYARTAGEWLRRFEAAVDRVVAMFGDTFARSWRLYLTGTQAAFAAGSLQLFQITFARSGEDVPFTRDALYRKAAHGEV